MQGRGGGHLAGDTGGLRKSKASDFWAYEVDGHLQTWHLGLVGDGEWVDRRFGDPCPEEESLEVQDGERQWAPGWGGFSQHTLNLAMHAQTLECGASELEEP